MIPCVWLGFLPDPHSGSSSSSPMGAVQVIIQEKRLIHITPCAQGSRGQVWAASLESSFEDSWNEARTTQGTWQSPPG